MTKKDKAWKLNSPWNWSNYIVTVSTPEMVGFSCWEMTGIRAIVGKSDGLVKDDSNLIEYLGGYRLIPKNWGYSK